MTKENYHYMLHKLLPGLHEEERKAIMLEAEIRRVKVPIIVVEALRTHTRSKAEWLEEQIEQRRLLERVVKTM